MLNYAMETLIVWCYGPPITITVRSAIEKHNRGISEEEEEKHNRSTTVAYQRRRRSRSRRSTTEAQQ